MGFLGQIFGDSDLGCAVGVAISPFGALASGECDATIEKVSDKIADVVTETNPIPFGDELKPLLDALLSPLPFFTLGRFASQQIAQRLNPQGLSPEARAELKHRLSSVEKLLFLSTTPLLFPGPLMPVAVGLERYVRPYVASVTAEDVGSFAADLFSTAAMIGFTGVGAKALSAGVKKAQAVAGQETLETYLEKIGGPGALLYFNPLF
jgi:hypothetical protein